MDMKKPPQWVAMVELQNTAGLLQGCICKDSFKAAVI